MNDYRVHFKISSGAKEYFVAYSHLAVLNIEEEYRWRTIKYPWSIASDRKNILEFFKM